MLTDNQLESALWQVGFYYNNTDRLQATLDQIGDQENAKLWRESFTEDLLNQPLQCTQHFFERDAIGSPWRYIGSK